MVYVQRNTVCLYVLLSATGLVCDVQAAAPPQSVAAYVCDVPISTPDDNTHHQEGCPDLVLIFLSAGVHHCALHQLHVMCLVSHPTSSRASWSFQQLYIRVI